MHAVIPFEYFGLGPDNFWLDSVIGSIPIVWFIDHLETIFAQFVVLSPLCPFQPNLNEEL